MEPRNFQIPLEGKIRPPRFMKKYSLDQMERHDHTNSLKIKEFLKSPIEKSGTKAAETIHLLNCKNVRLDPFLHPSLPSLRIHQESFEAKPRKNNFIRAQNTTKLVGIQPPSRFFLPLAVLPMQKPNLTGESNTELLLPDSYRVIGSFKPRAKPKIYAIVNNKGSNNPLADHLKSQSRSPLGIGLLHRNISKIGNLARESSLKSKLKEAKSQEEDIGKNIQKFLMISSKNSPKLFSDSQSIEEDRKDQRFDREIQGNKLLKKSGTLELEKKYESPVIHEMKRRRFVKEVSAEEELDETIKEAEISVSSLVSTKNYRGREKSFSVKHSFSFSESKDSNENKSTSVDCNKSSNTKGIKTFRSKENESSSLRSSGEKSVGYGRNMEAGYKATKFDSLKTEQIPENDKNANEIKPIHEEAAEQRHSPPDQSNPRRENALQGKLIRWKIGGFIGSGSCGQVYRAMEVDTGRIIAVKKLPIAGPVSEQMWSDIEKELSLLSKLSHENIVHYIGHEIINQTVCIYMEYVAGGNIQSIYSKFGALPERTIKLYTRQILHGLEYLHQNKVIHKDLKGANILIDTNGKVKLTDFGCSSEIERTLTSGNKMENETMKGSVPWMAPEVIKEIGYGRRADIWALGCTVLEMATGKAPWTQYNFENQITLLMEIALGNQIPEIPEQISDNLRDFLITCLQRDPLKRPYAVELLSHPFLQD